MKKFRRSTSNKVVAGIIGGIGEYFDIDPVLLRVVFIFFVLVTGFFPGVVAYFLALLVMPEGFASVIHEVPKEEAKDTPNS